MALHRDCSRTKLAAIIHHRHRRVAFTGQLLLACLLLVHHAPGVADAALSYPCPHTPNSQFPQEAMPKLPNVFEVHVEANIVKKQLTSEAVEVYDYPNKRAALSITTHNRTVTSIFNYATGERFDITPSGECKTVNLSESSFDVFGFTSPTPSGRPSIMQAADVFRFGDSFPKVFLGEEKVRGIPVYHWQSCQTMKTGSNNNNDVKAAYVIDYFFSKLGYTTATTSSLIPVRAFINGTALNVDGGGKPIGGTHNFSHVYDFSFFRPGPVEDDSLFEIPRGVVCERRSPAGSKPLPKLPDRFALSMEVYVAGTHRPPMTERMLFDFNFGLIQTDRFAPRGTGAKFSLTQLTIVEDYTHRVQYVIDSYDGNCTVKPMPQGLSTSSVGENGKRDITMRHGQQLLQHGDRDFKYQGQRWVRDIRVDVWADRTESGMIQEIYFLAGWPSERIMSRLSSMNVQLDWSRMNILVGTYLRNTTAFNADLGPFFRLFGDRAIKPWGDRWQRPSLGTPPTSSSMPRPGDLLRQHMMQQQRSRSQFRWDRMRLPYASEKMIHIFNYLPMHMDMSSFDVSPCYEKDADEMYVYFSLDGTYASVVTSQRYLFMSATKTAVAKAAGISVLRVVKVNVWQDIATSRLNIFFAMLAPPAVAGTGDVPGQASCHEAYDKLSRAVADGMVITIKHPVKQAKLEVVRNSLKKWDSLDHLFSKSDGDQSMSAGQLAMGGVTKNDNGAGDNNDGSSDSSGSGSSEGGSKGYTSGQFGGMAFAMLLVGMLLGVGGLYVALRRLRPDIHLLPYQQSK